MSLRREVQSYVGSHISNHATNDTCHVASGVSVFMLNVDTQLGMVMITLSQVFKKKLKNRDRMTKSLKTITYI